MISTHIPRNKRKEGETDSRVWVTNEEESIVKYDFDYRVRLFDFSFVSLYDGLTYEAEVISADIDSHPGYRCPCCDEFIAVNLENGEVWTGYEQPVGYYDGYEWEPYERHGVLLSTKVSVYRKELPRAAQMVGNYVVDEPAGWQITK